MKNAQITFTCDLYVSRDEETIRLLDCDVCMEGDSQLAKIKQDLGRAGMEAVSTIVMMKVLSNQLNLDISQIIDDLSDEHQELYKYEKP